MFYFPLTKKARMQQRKTARHRWRNRGGAWAYAPHFFLGLPSPPLFCLNTVSLSNIISIGSSDKVNCLMKKNVAEFWQYFVVIISNILGLFVIWQDFVIFGRIHRAQSVTLLWIAYRIGVVEQCCQMGKYNTIFHKNGVILHACVHGRRKEFLQGGPLVDFSKSFSWVGQKWWNLFFTTRNYENSIFCWNFQIPAPLPTPKCLRVGNVRATPLNNLGNFKRFNTVPNSEIIILNLIRNMKYVTDQFQLCFWFCIGNTK